MVKKVKIFFISLGFCPGLSGYQSPTEILDDGWISFAGIWKRTRSLKTTLKLATVLKTEKLEVIGTVIRCFPQRYVAL